MANPEKWSVDPSFRSQKKAKAEESTKAEESVTPEGIADAELFLSRPTKGLLKTDATARKLALKRHQIERISPLGKANPKSKDSADVFTANDNTRYAYTDLLRPTISDRIGGAKKRVFEGVGGAKRRTSERGLQWWEKNKKTVVFGSIALVAGLLVYSSWRNSQLERQLATTRARRRTRAFPEPAGSGSTRAGIFSQYGYSPFAPAGYELGWIDPCAYGCPEPQSFYDWSTAEYMQYSPEYSWW